MKLHMKGYILQLLAANDTLWDSEIAHRTCIEYGKPEDEYWTGNIRAILADLYSGGLVQTAEDTLDEATNKVHFRYAITEFGRQRMADTGLLDIEPKEATQ
ncbi:hypothetical protein [Ralstonia mojiangensis]|uniref:hypothetical protein n=1 Tax=Ralstonia mojiangensis TaxID=2953895 RepID=UPI0020911C0F|nr:hypothetical protein [Ralstonia mojiangensis]MCO5411745.1 hypothetical protein [Ralstonia mojiangensis]MCT7326446.1 hypothetical protein [Ralstonia mojiangensis]